jgi:hypothetical protein
MIANELVGELNVMGARLQMPIISTAGIPAIGARVVTEGEVEFPAAVLKVLLLTY